MNLRLFTFLDFANDDIIAFSSLEDLFYLINLGNLFVLATSLKNQ